MSTWKIWPLLSAEGKFRLTDSPVAPPNRPHALFPGVLISAELLKLVQLGFPLLLLAELARNKPPLLAPTVQELPQPAFACLYQANEGEVPDAAIVNVTVEPAQFVCD